MAKNKIEDLRNILFEAAERLLHGDEDIVKEENRMTIEKAEAICKISEQIIESAKVEVSFLKVIGGENNGTGFIPLDKPKD